MPRRKFADTQIALVVKELENGAWVEDVSRKLGLSDATVYNWKKKFVSTSKSELRRLRVLEEEDAKLK